MEKNIIVRMIKTKAYAEAKEVTTTLSLDCSQLSEQDFQEYALQSLVIKWQSMARRLAMKKEDSVPIPKAATWVVPRPWNRSTPSIEALLGTLSKEAKEALIKKLLEETEAEADPEAEAEPIEE